MVVSHNRFEILNSRVHPRTTTWHECSFPKRSVWRVQGRVVDRANTIPTSRVADGNLSRALAQCNMDCCYPRIPNEPLPAQPDKWQLTYS